MENAIQLFAGVSFLVIGLSHLLLRFVAPTLSRRVYAKAVPQHAWQFRIGGGAAILLGAFFVWLSWRGDVG